MNIVTVSSKNQITIPKQMLRRMKIASHRRLVVEQKKHNVIVLRPLTKSIVEEVGGSLSKYLAVRKRAVSFSHILKTTKEITSKKLARK